MNVGDTVRVLAPFNESFPDNYQITDLVLSDAEPTVYILGDLGGFDSKFLELVK